MAIFATITRGTPSPAIANRATDFLLTVYNNSSAVGIAGVSLNLGCPQSGYVCGGGLPINAVAQLALGTAAAPSSLVIPFSAVFFGSKAGIPGGTSGQAQVYAVVTGSDGQVVAAPTLTVGVAPAYSLPGSMGPGPAVPTAAYSLDYTLSQNTQFLPLFA